MMVNLLDTSKGYLLLKAIGKRCFRIKGYLDNYYKSNQICYLIDKVSAKIKIVFTNSFLEKVSRIREGENAEILSNSRVIRYLTNRQITQKKLMREYAVTSRIVISAKEIARAAYRAPIKTLCIIIILAILVNIFLSLFLKK